MTLLYVALYTAPHCLQPSYCPPRPLHEQPGAVQLERALQHFCLHVHEHVTCMCMFSACTTTATRASRSAAPSHSLKYRRLSLPSRSDITLAGVVSWWERGRGRCATSEQVRLDRLASELADCGRPPCLTHASRGAALCVWTGREAPLAGKGGVLGGQGTSYTNRSARVPRCGVG